MFALVGITWRAVLISLFLVLKNHLTRLPFFARVTVWVDHGTPGAAQVFSRLSAGMGVPRFAHEYATTVHVLNGVDGMVEVVVTCGFNLGNGLWRTAILGERSFFYLFAQQGAP